MGVGGREGTSERTVVHGVGGGGEGVDPAVKALHYPRAYHGEARGIQQQQHSTKEKGKGGGGRGILGAVAGESPEALSGGTDGPRRSPTTSRGRNGW